MTNAVLLLAVHATHYPSLLLIVNAQMAGVSTKRRPKASLENKGLQNEDPLENEDLKDPLKILSVMQWHSYSFDHVLWKQRNKFYDI